MELFRGNDTQQTESRINTILPSAWNNHSQVSYKGYRAVRERISCEGGGAYRLEVYSIVEVNRLARRRSTSTSH